MSAGVSHTCAIRSDKAALCWGDNNSGALGDGTTTERHTATQELSHSEWKQITAGAGHSCGIRTDNSLRCWGDNEAGQLGDGTTTERHVPTQEVLHLAWSQVSAGYGYTCAIEPVHLAQRNVLYCWGANNGGQLGIGSPDENAHPIPSLIGRDNGDFIEALDSWVSVSVGSIHTGGLRYP